MRGGPPRPLYAIILEAWNPRRLKGLERENARLKRVVADLSLEKAILKDVAEGNF